MAILATFIGIDRHHDSQIRDLAGARRDAVALWALFADTFPDATFRLLTDARATATQIRKQIDQTLGAAGADDTVVISFSGHGTHDHRLVAHDTAVNSLASTTIGMEEIAAAFRKSRARAILCLLDCCFSGGAPARVLDDSPIPRDPTTPLEVLAGVGRVLLSACNVNQVAYESPRHRHGLLTKAVIDVLREASEPTSIIHSLDRVMELIRAEAARMGVDQTPVLLGQVEGGLFLPPLRAGKEEHAHVQLTLLGRACGRSQLVLRSAMRLVELLRQVRSGGITAIRLMGLLQILDEADGGYTPVLKKGRKEAQWVPHVVRRYGNDVAGALQRFARDEFDYFGRCKRAALLHDWIDGVPVETLEQRYTTTPFQGRIGHGDIRNFADRTRMNLRSAHQIAAVMFMGSEPQEEEFEQLLRQLELGLPARLLPLLNLPLPLARGEYLALGGRGIRSPEDLSARQLGEIESALGADRAAQLESLRPSKDEAA